MTSQEIIDNNILIADFLQYKRSIIKGLGTEELKGYYTVQVPTNQTMYQKDYADIDKLRFHYSWDWLMMAVEHINFLSIDNYGEPCFVIRPQEAVIYFAKEVLITHSEEGVDCFIDNAYNTVVDFVKWYNKQKNGCSNIAQGANDIETCN